MFSIVEIKGKQYRVEEGASVSVDRIDQEPGSSYDDIKVLMHHKKEGESKIGQPYLDDVKVTAKVVEEERAEKVTAVRYKPKAGYTKRRGHRQKYTVLSIESIK